MNALLMAVKVKSISNSMIRKASLPHFRVSADQGAECMRVSPFNKLHRTLYGYVRSGGKQQMYVIRHEDKRVQRKASFTPIAVNGFQEQSRVRFDHEESAPLPCREGHKIRSWWRQESCRFQMRPQRLKPTIFPKANSARVELVPFPALFPPLVSHFGNGGRLDFLLNKQS